MHILWHFDETFKIARKLGFSPCAAYMLGIGNMDADLRHWDDEHWHGMTKANPKTGKATESAEDAEKAWQKHIDGKRAEAQDWLNKGNCCKALFALGQALHATQDREAHMGMTNPEHAVLELKGKSPDDSASGKKKAKERTNEFLNDFLDHMSPTNRSALKDCKCDCLDSVTKGVRGINMDLAGFKLIGLRFLIDRRKYDIIRWPESKTPKMNDPKAGDGGPF